MMGKFALLAALLVASAGALSISDTPGKTHDDEAMFEIHDQQVIPQYHSPEHGQGILVDHDDTTRHVGPPTQHEWEPAHGPWHPGPEFTNLTIYQVLSTNEHYSKLVRLINYDKDYVDFLNNTCHNITFFAPNNHALTFPKHKKGRKHSHEPHDVLATLYEQFESLDGDDERKKKILHAILQYHTLPKKVIRPALYFNTTFATLLIAKDGSFGGQARRIGVEHGFLPFGPLKINFYAFVLPGEWYTANGVVYTVSRPLLPPPSIINELYLGNHFFILTSALQKVGLDHWLSWGWREKKDSLSDKGATVTFFAPSDLAFKRLPPKLRRFLFSPFGAKALKKILSYHIVPDIILHTDYFYNATTKDKPDEEPQWHEEELHETTALTFGHTPHAPTERFDRRVRFGLAAAGRLPTQKCKCKSLRGWYDQRNSPGEEVPIPGSPDDRKFPRWPPRWPAPAKYHYVLPTVLEDKALHVTIIKPLPPHPRPPFEGLPDPELPLLADNMENVPPGTPPEHNGPKPPHHPVFKSSIIVEGQRTWLEAVARNGAVHSIGRLLNPCKKAHHEPSADPKEGGDDDWADWEDWLPAWAEL